MNTVEDLLNDAMKYEEKALIYYILYAIKKGKIQKTDPAETFNLNRFSEKEHQEVAKLIEENPLGIWKIRIFSLKRNRKRYEFIFAANEQEAAAHFRELFHTEPLNIHEYPLDFEMLEGKRVTSFREMRKRFNTFPAYLGYYEKQYEVIINGTNSYQTYQP